MKNLSEDEINKKLNEIWNKGQRLIFIKIPFSKWRFMISPFRGFCKFKIGGFTSGR